jgi:hypothetical protein
MWARAARDLDLDPQPHLLVAQRLDAKVQKMQIALVLLAASLFFFAIVSTVESLKRSFVLLFSGLGYVFAIGGVVIGMKFWN